MSLFSYIALPREVDVEKVRLTYSEDEVKEHVGLPAFDSSLDLLWFGKPGSKLAEAFPYGLTHANGRWNEVEGIHLYDPGDGIFDRCFSEENPVRLGFFGELSLSAKGRKRIVKHQRQQLYDLLKMFLNPGERAELYAEFTDHSDPFHVGPPLAEFTISIEEVLTDDVLDLKDGDKVTIVMT